MKPLSPATLKRRAAQIKCLFLDVDGVLTDCRLYLGPEGQEWKAVNVKDGLGMKLLRAAGVEIAVISGRPSDAMQRRLRALGLTHVYLEREDKLPAYEDVRHQLGLEHAQCAVMGDDLPDLPLMQRAGLAFAPADAHAAAKSAAHWSARRNGGEGAVREVCDFLVAAHAAAGRKAR